MVTEKLLDLLVFTCTDSADARIFKAQSIVKWCVDCGNNLGKGIASTYGVVWGLSLPTTMNSILNMMDKVSILYTVLVQYSSTLTHTTLYIDQLIHECFIFE